MKPVGAVNTAFLELMRVLSENKPLDRSDRDRAFAIVKTEVEKAWAYYRVFAEPRFEPFEE